MDYDFNVEQKMLKESARKFFSKEADSGFVREMALDEKGHSKKLWKKMAELGWTGLLIPEKYGGAEMSFLDMAVLIFEMGYACFPGPFFSTAVTSTIARREGGDENQKAAFLPKINDGKHLISLAWLEKEGNFTAREITAKAESQGETFVVSGTKMFVPDAGVADTLICALRTDDSPQTVEGGISLFLIDTKSDGLTVEKLKTIKSDKLCQVNLDRVVVPKENLLGEVNRGWDILEKVLLKAAVGKCAEMVGGGQKVLEMVVDYAKNRHQFGVPIGSFQAIQHHCANILTYVDTSTVLTYQAAWCISEGGSYAKEASMAKVLASDHCRKLQALGHQVMGGVGFIEEFDLQLYLRQAKAAELAFGNATFHRELVARQLDL
jgi:alkylation response protein AidB-like acyl-CoA dehydrogenase